MKKIAELSDGEKQRALDLYQKAIVVDGLNGSPSQYIQKIRDAGVTAANFTSFQNYHIYRYGNLHEVLVCISDWLDMADEHPDAILLALRSADIERAKREKKTAMILGLQNPKPIEDERLGLSGVIDYDFRPLRIFHRLGVRIIQIACDQRSVVGDGCIERTNAGLSDFGVKLVEEMNRLGVAIDLGHPGKATTLDAIEFSKYPVIFSHANVRAICDNPRNKGDEEIKALAEKGGVMGVTVMGAFVSKKPRPTIEDALDHIDYVVNLVGADHVGIGSDLAQGRHPEEMTNINRRPDVWGTFPWHMCIDDVSQFSQFAEGLVARGYSDEEILKILGGNFMRVFKNVWK